MIIKPVRSYVRRGRPTISQKRALRELHSQYVIETGDEKETSKTKWHKIFGRSAPLLADIGFGDGRTTAAFAAAHPEYDFIAFEVHTPGVGALINRLNTQELNNVRIVQGDVSLRLPFLFTAGALAGVNIFFPDPWEKKRHQKRRLINDGFIDMLAFHTAAGAFVHIATDCADYAQKIAVGFSAHDSFEALTADKSKIYKNSRDKTKFEERANGKGLQIHDLLYVKSPA